MSTPRNQRDLIAQLKGEGIVKSERVERVLIDVDRGDFTSSAPYEDAPASIGFHATISAPHMHAFALEHLAPAIKEDSRVLDVGSGSGYLAACFAQMVGERGRVVGIEHIDELVQKSEQNVRKHFAHQLGSGRLTLVAGDGRLGYPQLAPYDAIHVGAAADKLPQALVDQLAVGGRMVIPLESEDNRAQDFVQIDKVSATEFRRTSIVPVAYVPLTSKEAQLAGKERTFLNN